MSSNQEEKNNKSIFIPTEILQEISSHFKDDKFTLFSCILVSRHWCKSIIEILWSQPFHLSHSPRIIETYSSFLPSISRKNKPKPIFDYPSFLKKLSIPLLCNAIGEYIREELSIMTLPSSRVNFYAIGNIEQIMYTDLLKLLSKQENIQFTPIFQLLLDKQTLILRELCKLIYNKINVINELEFNIGLNDVMFLNQQLAIEELMKLQDCFKRLKVLNYSGSSDVLCFFAKHCRRIESLKLFQITYSTFNKIENNDNVINMDNDDDDDDDQDPSIRLISTQKSLRDLEIHGWNPSPLNITPLSVSTLLRSVRTQSDSLRIIKLISCDFYKSKPLWALSKCRNLEEIIIQENYNFDEKLLIPLTKVKFSNLKKFIYKYQLNNFSYEEDDFIQDEDDENEEEFIIEEGTDPDEIFSCIIINAKDSLQNIAINGFKTNRSLRNTLNSLTKCKNLIKLDIILEKSKNTLPLLLSVIENNQSLKKLCIISDARNSLHEINYNNTFIDVNQFLRLFIRLISQKFEYLCMYTPDWCFNTSTLNEFLKQAKFRIKSMCWMNYGCNLECSGVLRQYAILHNCDLLFGEDCEFINDNLGPFRMNVFFDEKKIE